MSQTAAAQIHTRHSALHGMPADFPVEQSYTPQHTRVTRAVRVSEREITLQRMPDDGQNRYVWLSFTLPGSNDQIKALGEVSRSSETSGTTHIRFKHLFPDYQERLDRFLAAHC